MLPPVPEDHIRLYRVDNTHRQRYRPVEGLSGRWFSDDPAYIEEHYAHYDTYWTYVDVPRELADQFRYENLVRTPEGGDLYGVEGKDFILPADWAERRLRCDRPHIDRRLSSLPTITEITSNVAKVGKVLYYNSVTGDIVVVEEVLDDVAVILFKNRHLGKESYVRSLVPIRKIKRM